MTTASKTFPLVLNKDSPFIMPVAVPCGRYASAIELASTLCTTVITDASDSPRDMMNIIENIMFECIGQLQSNNDTDRYIVVQIMRGLHSRLVEFRDQQANATRN